MFAASRFFKYCEILLEKYKDNEKILMINGNNFQDGKKEVHIVIIFLNIILHMDGQDGKEL